MLILLSRLFIALAISVSFSCYSIESPLDTAKFKPVWDHFVRSKEFNAQKAHPPHEFSLLEDFSDQQSIRYRPYIRAMDRYEDCRPYVENRITLLDGTEISASYVQLPELKKETHHFIASQAPSKNNIQFFWQMILEKNLDQIVMVTELVEVKNPSRELAYPYWPQKINEKMILENGLEITLLDERELLSDLKEKIQIRKFKLHSQDQDKFVTHYWYRNWIDNTAPAQPQTLLTLINTVEKDKNVLQSDSPILVHCSAGVGRTGVFITLYHLMQRAKNNDQGINLMDLVAYLRWQRPYLVGVLPQYQYCHQMNAYFQQLAKKLE